MNDILESVVLTILTTFLLLAVALGYLPLVDRQIFYQRLQTLDGFLQTDLN